MRRAKALHGTGATRVRHAIRAALSMRRRLPDNEPHDHSPVSVKNMPTRSDDEGVGNPNSRMNRITRPTHDGGLFAHTARHTDANLDWTPPSLSGWVSTTMRGRLWLLSDLSAPPYPGPGTEPQRETIIAPRPKGQHPRRQARYRRCQALSPLSHGADPSRSTRKSSMARSINGIWRREAYTP